MPPRPRCITVFSFIVSILAAGCSPKAKIERHVAAGYRYMAEGRYDAAEIEFLNAQRLDPRSGEAMAGLGTLFYDQGSLTKAAPRLLAARDLAPEALDARVRLARTYLTLGRPTEARTEALFVLGRRAGDPEALMILAETSTSPELVADTRARITAEDAASHAALAILDLREDRVDAATVHIDRALALDPKLAATHAVLAGLHLLRNEPEAAAGALKTAAELSPVRSPRRLALARFEATRGDPAAARATLEATLKQAPDFLPAAIMLAELEATSGATTEAQKRLDEVLRRDPDHPEALVLRARVLLSRGENTGAVAALEKLVARYPDAAQMHTLLASAYLATNDTTRASASLTRALQINPDDAEAAVTRAALQLRGGDAGAAVPTLREIVRKFPANTRARVLLADALRTRGQNDEALQVYGEAIQTAPQDPQLRLFAGILHAQLGQAAEARQAFDQALVLKPDYTLCVEQLVALDLAAGDASAAARRAEAHASAFPTSGEAHVLAAKVAIAQGDRARAETSLRRAIEANPETNAAYTMLAQVYLADRRQDEALANLRTAVARNPRDVAAFMLIGILLQERGELPAAREAYERLLQTNPRFVPALNNLAYLLSEDFGELDKAYELANRARELRPNDPVALDTFGWILFQRRDYTWAASVLSESASRLTANPEIQYHLGMARYMLGDEAGARAALSAAAGATADFRGKDKAAAYLAILEIAPGSATDRDLATLRARVASASDDPIALSRMAAIQAERGQHAEALASFEAVLTAHPSSATAKINLASYLLSRPDGLARAFDLAKDAYKSAPEDPTVLHTLGRAAFASGDHAWAATLLRDATRRAPTRPDVEYDFALAAFAVGQIDDAAEAMRIALSRGDAVSHRDAAQRFLTLAEAIRTTPVPTAAIGLAESVIATDPADVAALMVTGLAREQHGDAAGALMAFEKANSLYPRFAPALKRRAVILARENPPAPATLEIATRAREALPGDPEVAAALGTIHFRRAEFPRAATLLSEAVRAPSATAETYATLGLAQVQVGEKDRGRISLARALDMGLSGPLADEVRAALGTTGVAP
ncbi:MAG: tetratricopeptide repeat protein [Opitutaceae bacterium]|nr:tetratricopeptide repeat protein [Opitutaceae bacterium]